MLKKLIFLLGYKKIIVRPHLISPAMDISDEGHNHPREIVSIILSSLPMEAILKFRFVCKLWHRLITSDPLFIERQLRRAPLQLIIQDITIDYDQQSSDGSSTALLDLVDEEQPPRNDNHIISKRTLALTYKGRPEFSIFTSCDGLLCFRLSLYLGVSVCNPLLGEWIDIPKSQNHPDGTVCGFYHHKPSQQYRLLQVKEVTKHLCEYEIFTLGSDSETWRSIPWTTPYSPKTDPPVVLNGALHWLSVGITGVYGWDCCIIVFDQSVEDFRLMDRPHGTGPEFCNDSILCRLIDMDGSLAFCQSYMPDKEEIWILKDYGNKGQWERKYIICTGGVETWRTGCFKPICARDGEILFCWPNSGIIYYNITSGSFKCSRFTLQEGLSPFSPILYKRSTVSLLALCKKSQNRFICSTSLLNWKL